MKHKLLAALFLVFVSIAGGCAESGEDKALRPSYQLPENGAVASIAFSPDESLLIAALVSGGGVQVPVRGELPHRFGGGRLSVFQIAQEKRVASRDFRTWPMCLEVTSDGQTVIAGFGRCRTSTEGRYASSVNYKDGGIGKVRFFDLPSLDEQETIETGWSVYGLTKSPQGDLLAAIGARGTKEIFVRVWRLEGMEEVASYEFEGNPAPVGGPGPIRPLAFSPDGRWLLAATSSSGTIEESRHGAPPVERAHPGRVAVIDMERHEVVGEFEAPLGPVTTLSISPDGKHVLLGRDSTASDVVAIDYEAAEIEPVDEAVVCLAVFSRRVEGVAYFCAPLSKGRAGGRVVGPADLKEWYITGRVDWLSWAALNLRRNAFAVSPTERYVAAGDVSGKILVWDLSQIPLEKL